MAQTEPAPSYADERTLIQAARTDPSAFTTLYRQYEPRVYRYVRTLTSDDEDAADITQQVFLEAWHALDGYQQRSSFATWLFRIAHNRAIDAHRRQRPAVPWEQIPESLHPRAAGGPEDGVLRQEAVAELRRALARLDDDKRTVLMLRFAAQLSVAEVAAVVGKRPEAVKKQILRSLRTLKGALS